jgi:hypothetical protein
MAQESERREDTRYSIDLITRVTADGAGGAAFSETTSLRNMSGGGANFKTRCPERYFEGQRLNLQIDLPGTVELKAYLLGSATVSRIERLPDSDPQQAARSYAVAVVIALPLQFVRKDAGAGKASLHGE